MEVLELGDRLCGSVSQEGKQLRKLIHCQLLNQQDQLQVNRQVESADCSITYFLPRLPQLIDQEANNKHAEVHQVHQKLMKVDLLLLRRRHLQANNPGKNIFKIIVKNYF
jgi:hypothetical protein